MVGGVMDIKNHQHLVCDMCSTAIANGGYRLGIRNRLETMGQLSLSHVTEEETKFNCGVCRDSCTGIPQVWDSLKVRSVLIKVEVDISLDNQTDEDTQVFQALQELIDDESLAYEIRPRPYWY